VSEGNLVSTNGLVTTVVQLNPIWVRFSVNPRANLPAAMPGGRFKPGRVRGVELILPDGSTYPVRGKLNFAASQLNPTLGTQQLRGEFANPDGRLMPGQFVRARLLTGERSGVFKVPQNAVVQTDRGAIVMTADADNKVAPRPVKTGQWSGKDWVILDGLKAGDKVIVDNLIKLRPGATGCAPCAGRRSGGAGWQGWRRGRARRGAGQEGLREHHPCHASSSADRSSPRSSPSSS
jgi:membrane fusion protein (multidrug efflux system)